MLRMASWILVVSLAVRLYSLPQALRIVSTLPKSQRFSPEDQKNELATAIDALLAINLFVFKPVCWKRAAVLHRYLALGGTTTRIVFGVRKDTSGELTGHAWLEAEGEPILEVEIPNYSVTYTFPSSEAFEGDLAILAKGSAN